MPPIPYVPPFAFPDVFDIQLTSNGHWTANHETQFQGKWVSGRRVVSFASIGCCIHANGGGKKAASSCTLVVRGGGVIKVGGQSIVDVELRC